jgi:hypothetical protein
LPRRAGRRIIGRMPHPPVRRPRGRPGAVRDDRSLAGAFRRKYGVRPSDAALDRLASGLAWKLVRTFLWGALVGFLLARWLYLPPVE